MIVWSVALGAVFGVVLLALGDAIPRLFTSDPAVVEQAHEIWWLFAAMMPLNGAVFALDGILIGAGDTRFLMWGMLAAAAVYVPVALLALAAGWGILGVWCGLAGLIAVRLATCGARFAGAALGAHRRTRATMMPPHAPPSPPSSRCSPSLLPAPAALAQTRPGARAAARSARCRSRARADADADADRAAREAAATRTARCCS